MVPEKGRKTVVVVFYSFRCAVRVPQFSAQLMHVGGVDMRCGGESLGDVMHSRQHVHHDSNVLATSGKLRRGALANQIL